MYHVIRNLFVERPGEAGQSPKKVNKAQVFRPRNYLLYGYMCDTPQVQTQLKRAAVALSGKDRTVCLILLIEPPKISLILRSYVPVTCQHATHSYLARD